MGVKYSILDLAPVRTGGSVAESFRNTLDLARHAEQWGYTRFWLAEHHNMPGIASAATAVLIGYVAGGTSRIRVGSGGVMLPNHSPLVIAEQFGTLETLYPGRIDLGIGRAPGTDPVTAHALRRGLNSDSDFPSQVAELLAYLGEPGPGQRLQAVPGSGSNVPVWLLGSSTFSAQLAAMLSLPFAFASHFAPELLDEAIAIYRHGFHPNAIPSRPAPEQSQPYLAAGVPLIAAETDDEAAYLATSTQQRALNLIRGEPIYTPPPIPSMDGLWNEAERAAVESRMSVAVIGGPETVRAKLTAFVQRTGVQELIVVSDIYDHRLRLRSFEIAAEIIRTLS